MHRFAPKLVSGTAFVVTAAVLGGACLDPTQITLEVTSNVPCDVNKGTSFTGGKPGSVERAAPNTTTMDCNGGRIGTLVATPAGDKDSAAAFMIVQGVDRPTSECAANKFKGCIVQRRILRYISHTPLTLPVTMRLICKDQACDEFSTCAKSGACVSATIKNPEDCANGTCVPEGDELGGDGLPDASVDGDGTTVDGPADSSKSDAPGDSGTDAPPPPPPGTLYCPLTPGCQTATQKCCWKRQSTTPEGVCTPSGDPCARGSADLPMQCNRKSDCTGGQFCCATDLVPVPSPPPEQIFSDTHCSPVGLPCKFICLDTSDCPQSALPMRCDQGTPYFTPAGIMGVCVSGPQVEDSGAPL